LAGGVAATTSFSQNVTLSFLAEGDARDDRGVADESSDDRSSCGEVSDCVSGAGRGGSGLYTLVDGSDRTFSSELGLIVESSLPSRRLGGGGGGRCTMGMDLSFSSDPLDSYSSELSSIDMDSWVELNRVARRVSSSSMKSAFEPLSSNGRGTTSPTSEALSRNVA
jgi:hypothetical protein